MDARLLIRLVFLLVSLAACATAPVPRAEDSSRSGIGIDVQFEFPISFFLTYGADGVYFASSCKSITTGCDEKLYPSNFAKDGRIYLLNAPPGVYEAVASIYLWGVAYIAYFPQKLVAQTRAKVEKGTFAYAGTYVIKLSLGICPGEADETQLFYAEKFQPGTPKCSLIDSTASKLSQAHYIFVGTGFVAYGYVNHYRASIIKAYRDETHEHAFLEKAQKDLASGGWHIPLK